MNDKQLRMTIAETITRHTGAPPPAAYDASTAIMEQLALTPENLPLHIRRSPRP